ncbi:MAG TPA: hypothetical protein VFB66_24835 [Tepidisphaeraceae bacterium]|nr:hypothetical protein [Tepidisphaeraceae bacterium]
MRQTLLAWYQNPAPRGTSYFEQDLGDPEKVVEVFAYAHLSLARITREGWKFLWWNYGLDGLLQINQYAEWFDTTDEEEAGAQMLRESLLAGYDPISGFYGEYSPEARTFELSGRD